MARDIERARACARRYYHRKLAEEGQTFREKRREQQRKWWHDSNYDFKTKRREDHLRRKYGMSLAEFASMSERQNGKCAICRCTPYTLCVDHCHKTGRVRELLCQRCNRTIGQAGDSISLLRASFEYLERHYQPVH